MVQGELLTEWPGKSYRSTKRTINPDRRTHRETTATKPFVAWDGEGYSDDEGEHHYMLFGNSEGRHIKGKSLTWEQCFPLLVDSPNVNNVIFGGDYDVIMMIRTMPWIVRSKLFKGEWVRYGGYTMQWRRRKFFMLKQRATGKSVILYDVQSFFQTTFVKACREYLGDSPDLDAMHGMKLQRDAFTFADDRVIEYWKSELDYLVRLMECLRDLLLAVDIKPKGWYGPGAVANRVLQREQMQDFYAELPEHIVDKGERAYYGGRFEQFRVGRISDVMEYDIRSAYPDAISRLPHFNSLWHQSRSMPGPYALVFVSWNIPDRFVGMPGPLPWRDSRGRIYFPLRGSGWYWGVEVIESLCKSFPESMWTIHEVWEPEFTTSVKPFSWIADMYHERAEMKRNGNPAQKALKLAMNSVYGKLAQSIGARRTKDGWVKPKWHHVLFAGWVTAATRAKIYNAIRFHRQYVVAIETDAIFMTKPMEHLPLSDTLGDWEAIAIPDMLYISSGVYYAIEDDKWKFKSRGVESDKSKPVDYWMEVFSRVPQTTVEVTMTLRRFGTDIRLPDRFARWYDHSLTTTVPGGMSKRIHVKQGCIQCEMTGRSFADAPHSLIVPHALIDSNTEPSTPYKFPWRQDVEYEWPTIVHSDAIELPEEETLTWT